MAVRPTEYFPSEMKSTTTSIFSLAVLILAVLMIIATTISITLLFTIGKPTNNSEINNKLVISTEPCNCGCPAITPQITPRIVNGEAAIPNSWPWQLLLVVFTYDGFPASYCGASLITTTHVLTAAHCVFGISPRCVGVISRLHIFNISLLSPNIAYMAERIYVHESYDDRTLNDDVAVIRLHTAIILDEKVSLVCIAPEKLGEQELKSGEALIAVGWGAMNSVNRTRPSVLQQVRLEYVLREHPSCAPLTGDGDSTRAGQICAGFPPRSVCFGDSGGPLVRSIRHSNGKTYWQQVGIMSGTVDCGYTTNFSDVYARVNYYYPWIVDKIRIST